MPFASLAEVLRHVATEEPEREAYEHDGKRATYGWLDRVADGFAATLLDLDVGPGSTVCLLLPSSIKLAACYFGAARVGAVTCAVDLRCARDEQERMVARSRPSVTVLGDGTQVGEAAVPGPVIPVTELKDAFTRPAPRALPVVGPDDAACKVWTLRGTGPGSCTVYSHGSLRATASARSGTDAIANHDRISLTVPCSDVDYMVGVYAFTQRRATIVLSSTSELGGRG